ncbi:WXG100 family type VII secretion target [Corynebacterium sp.]|uniref:WXG100 family type VII secretion target n=1 Tax=Corynebacterium sp. TaxID=1720 RepID=UPI0026DBEF44|nr:WXG100 family type VII secretion target [Corynebacterium sp.]MDO5077056.1 WXG100 family type VII secretion target [Corynebacterium sp.]
MYNTIKYSFGEIQNAAADIQTTSASIDTILNDLKRQLEPMVETWEGESALAYQAAQAQWDNAAAELNSILATIASAVSEGNDRMGDVNRRAAASWG